MAPLDVDINRLDVLVTAKPLTPTTFAPYGEVIQNPNNLKVPIRDPSSSTTDTTSQKNKHDDERRTKKIKGVSANQGTATKYPHVTRPRNLYAQAPSRVPAELSVSMFACRPRTLLASRFGTETEADDEEDDHRQQATTSTGTTDMDFPSPSSSPMDFNSASDHHQVSFTPQPKPKPKPKSQKLFFPVKLLERHPFTTQSFIPISSSSSASDQLYLIIVSPSLPPSRQDQSLPVPYVGADLPGSGLPHLSRLEAFVGRSGQGVTYGAGVWHAPMVALSEMKGGKKIGEGEKGGEKTLDFVVVQYANGVSKEDCQEVAFSSADEKRYGVCVEVPAGLLGGVGRAKL